MGLLPPRATARMTGLPARGSLPGPVLLLLACCSTASPPPAGAAPPSGLPAPAGLVVAGESSAPLSPPGLRLPATFRPTAQRVELTIVPSSGSFEGTTELDGELASATDVVWLNARALVVKTATALSGGTETSARPFTSPERVALRFPRQLGPGRATLRLAFSGVISATELSGVFHQEEGGDFYAMTQFEETDARRAFPCVDEPNAKIPWELTLRVPAGLTAVSNTPVVSQEPDGGGMKRVHFARTKPLPPYLVAFGVGPYDVAGARPAGPNGVPMRVYALRSRAAEAAYAARTSPEILEVLETYFGIPYPFEKLDVLAIPLFNGAMENAGLVTIGSRWLLARRQDESLGFQRTWAAYFAAHEFAHQWFGDLVTLAWWDDTWLNESFATWMANKAVNTWAPGWGYDVEDVTDRSAAATADTLATARSIRQPIETYDDISNAFDRISYEKGAAVLRMFESYLGKEPFRDGVRRYLAAHAYGNATASDFLAAISEATGRDVAPAFNSFLDQSGVPELTVALSCPRGKEPGLELAQRRLIPVGSTAGDDRRWQVPVCARWAREGKEQRACTLLTAPAARLALGAGPCPDWVLPNAGYTGYYRLKLEGSLLRALVERGRRSLTTAETVGLLGDVDALVNAGRYPAAQGLELSTHFAAAPERLVMEQTIALATVRRDFLEAGVALAYPAWVRRHFGARARALGMEARPGEDEDTRLLRPRLVKFAAVHGEDPQLIAGARALTERWLQDPVSVDPDMVETVLAIAATFGDAGLHTTLTERLKANPDRAMRNRLVTALSAFRAPALVKANLELVLAAPVDPRELTTLLAGGLRWPEGRELVFQTVREHFDLLTSRLPERNTAYLFYVGRYFCDAKHRAAVEAAFGPRAEKAMGGKRDLAQILEAIDLCIAERAVQAPSITSYLSRAAR